MTPPNDHSRTGESAPLPTGTTRPRMPKPSDISAGVSDPYLVILASAGTGKMRSNGLEVNKMNARKPMDTRPSTPNTLATMFKGSD